MNNKIYFEFYRDFDDYPLSAGFYDSNILKTIKPNTNQCFYDPVNDRLETHTILAKRIAYYKGNIIMVAVTLNTIPYTNSSYSSWSPEDSGKFHHYTYNCLCNAMKNFREKKGNKKQ